MGVAENKEVVMRQLQLVSEGDARGAAALYAPACLNHGRPVGREDIARIFESIVALHEQFTIQEIIGEGDWVACRAVVTGKHATKPDIPVGGGVYSMAQPMGREYSIQHIHLYKVVDGMIVEHWANRDDLGAARQLGLELGPKAP